MKIGNKEFDTNNNTYIMGILNITPDSFSDGGNYTSIDKALKQTEKMIDEGAAIIDIGGESTRPGSSFVSAQEEIERTIPIIKSIKNNFDIPISLDTYKASVAKAGISEGVDLINDIWGLNYDNEMAEVIAQSDIPCCLMHNRKEINYIDFLSDVTKDLKDTLEIARKAGIKDNNIILDPGVGFGKTYEQNLQIINELQALHSLGFPILLGTSRKSVIGLTLDLPVSERVEGTLVTSVFAVLKKCAFIRVHDIKENFRAIKMTQAILKR
ncbi:dihydropteroate synthase [Anaerovorax odorimutans]|uniref:dihydropteroate synthase n=1 Tax=Anaerovorax odorimutans TaxID=109327 RepID=UPI00041420CC|nr:dihydropteroate synthase [Anaerovorax odorimutans]